MTSKRLPLLAAVVLCGVVVLHAFPMDSVGHVPKCQCIRTSSAFIAPQLFKKILVLPFGAHCRQTEIIITKKDGSVVCVNPEAKWVNKILSKLHSHRK